MSPSPGSSRNPADGLVPSVSSVSVVEEVPAHSTTDVTSDTCCLASSTLDRPPLWRSPVIVRWTTGPHSLSTRPDRPVTNSCNVVSWLLTLAGLGRFTARRASSRLSRSRAATVGLRLGRHHPHVSRAHPLVHHDVGPAPHMQDLTQLERV